MEGQWEQDSISGLSVCTLLTLGALPGFPLPARILAWRMKVAASASAPQALEADDAWIEPSPLTRVFRNLEISLGLITLLRRPRERGAPLLHLQLLK